LQVTRIRVGAPPCGAAAARASVPPGHDVVVGLGFLVGSPCPGHGEVIATLTIDAGGREAHAVTPSLRNLTAFGFAGC
jgi:hypothetical protein